jgi:hypothetical protein
MIAASLLVACNPISPTAIAMDNGVEDILWVGNDQILTGPLDMQTLLLLEVAGTEQAFKMERAINPRYTLSSDIDGTDLNPFSDLSDQDILIIQAFDIQRGFSETTFEESATSWIEVFQAQEKNAVVFYPWFTKVDVEADKENLDEMIHKFVWQQNLTLVPVGPAWEAAMQARPDIQLYASDGIHPSALGVYLTACVFYASLTGESPLENPVYTAIGYDSPQEIVKLDGDTIEFLQWIAWETINDYLQKDEFRVIIKE